MFPSLSFCLNNLSETEGPNREIWIEWIIKDPRSYRYYEKYDDNTSSIDEFLKIRTKNILYKEEIVRIYLTTKNWTIKEIMKECIDEF